MARLGDKSKLLELLAETPIVSFACKKLGLDRTTYYRWYKDDRDFREQADHILSIGRMRVNDMAESVILKKINADDTRCAIFWLEHNEPRYRPVKTTYTDPIAHQHELAPGEICRSCGYFEPEVEEYKQNKKGVMSNKQLSDALYKRLRSINTRKQSEVEIRKIIDDFIEKNNLGKFEIHFVDGSKKDDTDEKEIDDLNNNQI